MVKQICVTCGRLNPKEYQDFCIDLNCSGRLMTAAVDDNQKIEYTENPVGYVKNLTPKVYNIDFDGTLTTGEYTENPKPNKDIIKKVVSLYMTGNIIIIWTARWWNQASFVVSWLIKNNIPFHGVMMGKGGSDFYVDDHAVTLEGFLEGKE